MDLFNLEKHFAFYGAYHSNPVNILIHMVFVWPILFTVLMLLYHVPLLVPFPNVGFLTALVYGVYYVGMDKKAGCFGALLCFLSWFCASGLAKGLGFSATWKLGLLGATVYAVLVAQLICWTAQFLGHGVFEKRAPALLDNLVQAFLMAPFFVLLEALQHFVGYEPYPGFRAKVQIMIEENIKEWREKKHKKSS